MRFRQRRRFLQAALSGAGAVVLGAAASAFGVAAQEARDMPRGTALRDTALRGGLLQLSGAGGNIVLLGGATGVVMVDSGAPEHAAAVAQFVRERFGGAPLATLLNTHWHLEHTGGNEAVGGGTAKIVAHESTRLWMSTQFYVDWQNRTYEPRAAAAQPNETFYSSARQPLVLEDGGQHVEYGLLREAHTDGDIYVRFPEHNVLVAGGAFTVGEFPIVDPATGGALDGLIAATRTLLDLCDADTLIVPAMGAAQRRRDLAAQLDMLTKVRERMDAFGKQGKSAKEMLAAGITAEFAARWQGNAERFVRNAYTSLWGISG